MEITIRNKKIELTRTEKELLLALIYGEDKIVPVKTIMEKAWIKNDVSIFTFRNMIKKIRDKTYYELIKNHSNIGYSINIR